MKRNKKTFSKQRNLIAINQPKSTSAEQYRTVRTNIEFSQVNGKLSTIVVTSSGQGEGKSTTAANLAVVIAQQGKKVLLIDADLRKPTMHYTFKLANNFGLTTLLTNKNSIKDSLQETEINNLFILTSGPIPPNPAELLSSSTMKNYIKQFLTRFDTIIIDSPPILAVTDAQIISSICDGTVLVVRSGITEKEAGLRAKELLLKSKAKLLGVILNAKPATKKENYYYYYSDEQ